MHEIVQERDNLFAKSISYKSHQTFHNIQWQAAVEANANAYLCWPPMMIKINNCNNITDINMHTTKYKVHNNVQTLNAMRLVLKKGFFKECLLAA